MSVVLFTPKNWDSVSLFLFFNENIKNNDRSLSNFIELFEPQGINGDFKNGIFKRLIRKFGIFQAFTDLHSPWKNWAEPEIGEIKRYARKIIQASNTLVRLWCFCYEYSAELLSILANGIFDLQGRTIYEAVIHYTTDILEYVLFEWFQWCWYFDEDAWSKHLWRWIIPAHQFKRSFCSYVILENGDYIARSSVVPIPKSNFSFIEMKDRMQIFIQYLESRIGNYRQPL